MQEKETAQSEAKQREAERARSEAHEKEAQALMEVQRNEERRQRELEESQSRPIQIQEALGVPIRVAVTLASAPHLQEAEMRKWFEDGRLPGSFSPKLLWKPVVAQLERFGETLTAKEFAITSQQQQRENFSQKAQLVKQQIQELRDQLKGFEEEEQRCLQEENALKTKLKFLKELEVIDLLPFVRNAAKVEEELASELNAALDKDREGLFALNEEGTPKLGLLMNCFGASARAIQELAEYSGTDFPYLPMEEVKALVAGLPRYQQDAVFYAQERLKNGKLPFAEHDCALCDCETPEEMAAFLHESGFEQVTADHIRRTGAFGRGALLFLTPQELQLGNGKDMPRALAKCRASHRKA